MRFYPDSFFLVKRGHVRGVPGGLRYNHKSGHFWPQPGDAAMELGGYTGDFP
jgi:hypothetical protein